MRAPSSRTTFSARINAAPILLLGCSLNPRKAPSKKRRTLQGNGMTSICHAPRRASFTLDTNNSDSGRSAGDRGVADMEITIEELRFEMPLETEARHGIVLQLDQLARARIGGLRDDDVRRAFPPKPGNATSEKERGGKEVGRHERI